MDEYIEREAAIAAIMSEPPDSHYPQWYADKIKAIPASDVAPVRHGRWICINKSYGEYECSVCHGVDSNCSDYYGTHVVTEQDFCPHCGASMDLEVSNGKSETVWYAPQGDSE